MNRKFVSKSNRVLRKILNSENSLDIVQDFIETFLKIKIQEIKLNPYLNIRSNYLPSDENFGIVDVRIKTKEEELNIGIQFIDGYYIQNKMLLYYMYIHSNQIYYNDKRKLSRTITINLLDFNYFKHQKYLSKLSIPSNSKENILSKEIEMYVIELEKFINKHSTNISKQEAWLSYLKGDNLQLKDEILNKFDKIRKLDDLLNEYWKEETIQ